VVPGRAGIPSFNIPDVPNSMVKVLYGNEVVGRKVKLAVAGLLFRSSQAAWTRGGREALGARDIDY